MSNGNCTAEAGEHAFSVVIPLYNKAPHIRRSLESVLAQSVAAREILVVDDGSTDGGADIVTTYGNRVQLLQRKTPGPGGYAGRNLGIQTARSPWIAFLDADDEWQPEHIENLTRSLARDSAGPAPIGVFAGYVNVFHDGSSETDSFTNRVPERRGGDLELDEFLEIWIRLRACPIWTSASAFRRDRLIEAGLFPDGRALRGGDKDTWLRLAALGPVRHAPGVTAIYHRDAVNMVTRTTTTNVRHCICESVETIAAGASSRSRELLFRMCNEEVFRYGLQATKTGPIDLDVYRGFKKSLNPAKFLLLIAASTRGGAAALQVARRLRSMLS
jgi:glycosyltransferase involved in cell wall biosynthesis